MALSDDAAAIAASNLVATIVSVALAEGQKPRASMVENAFRDALRVVKAAISDHETAPPE